MLPRWCGLRWGFLQTLSNAASGWDAVVKYWAVMVLRWSCIVREYDYVQGPNPIRFTLFLESWNAVDVDPDIVGRYFMPCY